MIGSRSGRIVAVLGCTLLSGGVSRSQSPQQLWPAEAIKVVLRAVSTPVDGSAFEAADDDRELSVGQTGSMTFAVGDTLCQYSIGARPQNAANTSWTVNVTVVSAAIDRIAIDLIIDRRSQSQVHHDVRHLVLTEQATHTIDFIETADADLGRCRIKNTLLYLSASIVNAHASAEDALTFDVWLVNGRNPSARQHETHVATGGAAAPFRFQSLPLQIGSAAHATAAIINEDVSGMVRARVRPDGRADVSVTVSRNFSDGSGSVGDGGGPKRFSVGIDEPVAIELPSPRGVMNGLDLAEQFGSHMTQLIVVLHRRRN